MVLYMIKRLSGKFLQFLQFFANHECFTIESFLRSFLLCNYKTIFMNMALLKYFKIEKRHSGLPIKSKLLKYCVAHGLLYPHFS